MMKLKPFILVSLLILTGSTACACGLWYCSSAENDIYRLLPYGAEGPALQITPDFSKKNILLWSRQTGCKDTAAIRRAIYTEWDNFMDWEKLLSEMRNGNGKNTEMAIRNTFCRKLVENSDTDAVRLICWSKKYSNIRNAQRSPWYYNSHISDEKQLLQEIYSGTCSYKPTKKYADRYAFLVMKCKWAVGDDNATLALWDKMKDKMNGSIFQSEAEDYAARSFCRLGRTDEACKIYLRRGDIGSVMQLKQLKLPELLNTLLRIAPESPILTVELQRVLFSLENNPYVLSNKICIEGYCEDTAVLHIAQRAARTTVLSRRAIWNYTAACLLDYQHRPKEALRQLDGIDTLPCDDFLRKSIRVLRFYLRSQTERIDDDFESYALSELHWMDKELQKEWKRLPEKERFKLSHISSPGGYELLRSCFMYDAMRRILLPDSVGLCERMAANGRQVRALQLANMAENRLFTLTNNKVIKLMRERDTTASYRANGDWNEHPGFESSWVYWLTPDPDTSKWYCGTLGYNGHDYSNWMFLLADKMSAHTILQYRQRILHPLDREDRWLNARGYADADYWEDIIGTHYLRECNYSSAVKHLSKVSPSYQRRMNINFVSDPFSYKDMKNIADNAEYKLHFAKRMAQLQHQMQNGSPDSRGLAMLEYSIGMRNSFDQCWYLTTYGKTFYEPDPEYASLEDYQYALNPLERLAVNSAPFKAKHTKLADSLQHKAFTIIESDEAKARAYARIYMMTKVKNEYRHTRTGQFYALICDGEWMYTPYRYLMHPHHNYSGHESQVNSKSQTL